MNNHGRAKTGRNYDVSSKKRSENNQPLKSQKWRLPTLMLYKKKLGKENYFDF